MNKFTVIYNQPNKNGKIVQNQVTINSSSIESAEEYFRSTYMETYSDIELISIIPELSLF